MKTLQDEWKQYRNMVYPEDIPADQNRECHQAFMAGALVALNLARAASELPEAEAEKELAKVFNEASEWCKLHSIALFAGRS